MQLFPVGRWPALWLFRVWGSFHLVALPSSRALGPSVFSQHMGSFYGQDLEIMKSLLPLFHWLQLSHKADARKWEVGKCSLGRAQEKEEAKKKKKRGSSFVSKPIFLKTIMYITSNILLESIKSYFTIWNNELQIFIVF